MGRNFTKSSQERIANVVRRVEREPVDLRGEVGRYPLFDEDAGGSYGQYAGLFELTVDLDSSGITQLIVSGDQVQEAGVWEGPTLVSSVVAGTGMQSNGIHWEPDAPLIEDNYIYLKITTSATEIERAAALPDPLSINAEIIPLWFIPYDSTGVLVDSIIDLRNHHRALPTRSTKSRYMVLALTNEDSSGGPALNPEWDWPRFHL